MVPVIPYLLKSMVAILMTSFLMIFLPGRRRPTGRRELKAYIIIHGSGNKVNPIGPPGLFRYGRYYSLAMGWRAAPALLRGGRRPPSRRRALDRAANSGDGQPLTADGGGQAAGLDGLGHGLLAAGAAQRGAGGCWPGFCGAGRRRPGPPGRSGPSSSTSASGAFGDHAQHGGRVTLGAGREAVGRDVKEQFRVGVVLAEHGEGPVVRRAGGADPAGYLPLDHHGNGGEAFGLQQGGDGGEVML